MNKLNTNIFCLLLSLIFFSNLEAQYIIIDSIPLANVGNGDYIFGEDHCNLSTTYRN